MLKLDAGPPGAHPSPPAASGGEHQEELRLWLRLLTCTTLVESEVRRRLRAQFGLTLPRFDLMAQLDRAPEGLTLGDLSRRLMVSNGNVTGLVERLATSGQVERVPHALDRRVVRVRLTAAGRAAFGRMARAHAGWIAELLGGLTEEEGRVLMRLLGRLKQTLRERD
jgi:DNA-binding MarR family transcriptional regulator